MSFYVVLHRKNSQIRGRIIMDKEKIIRYTATFLGGALFGSAGLKLLSSRDAKHAYVKAAAAGLRVKDYVLDTVEKVQAGTDDVIAEAKALNEERDNKETVSEE